MRVAVVLTIAVGFTLGLAAGATRLVGREPPPAPPATAVVWADRVFVSRHDLAAWLEARGANYDVWAVRHPALAGTFDARPGAPVAVGPAAKDPGNDNSMLVLVIAGVMLATVFALMASRASSRFAHLGGMRVTNVRQRIRLSHRPAVVGYAAGSKAPEESVSSRWLHFRSVARDALAGLRRAVVEARRAAAHSLTKARRRRSFVGLAWYATSGLLAFAVGAWVAIFLK